MLDKLRWAAVRDVILFFAGLLGVAHEVLLTSGERPSLLILAASMMGLPAVLRGDARKASNQTLPNGEDQDVSSKAKENGS